MTVNLTADGVALVLAILGHGGVSIWWASRVTAQIGAITNSIANLDKELEKRDSQITALWRRIDEVRDMVPSKN